MADEKRCGDSASTAPYRTAAERPPVPEEHTCPWCELRFVSTGEHPWMDHLAVGAPDNCRDRMWNQIAALRASAERYREALETIQRWDMLNPPRTEVLADAKWLRGLVDEDLAATGDEAGSPLQQAERRLGEPRMVRRMGDFGVEVVPVDGDEGKGGDRG